MATSRLKIGVLLVPPVQLLDLAAVDLFHMLSKQYLRECQLPQSVVDIAIDEVHIRYISESGPSQIGTISVVPLTASCFVQVTDHLDSPKVAAGSLDILFVPGPDPSLVPSEPVRQFVRKHAEHEHTTVISVCTGIYVLGYAGVLDGQTVSGPRALVDMDLKKKFPKARWGDRRWEIGGDGRLWTSGGITNGQDMVAAYIRAHYSRELADLVCTMAEVGERGRDYGTGKAAATSWFLWIVLRSWVKGIFSGSTPTSKQQTRSSGKEV